MILSISLEGYIFFFRMNVSFFFRRNVLAFSFYYFLFFVTIISFASYLLSINLVLRSSAIAQIFVSYISVCPNVNFHYT